MANTGLLDGHKATTHHYATSDLKTHTRITVMENSRFVLDGKFLTTAGVTSGIDGALEVIELIDGKELADKIARIIVYDREGDLSFLK